MTTLVLVGAGHAHARVLLELALRPIPQVEVILINPAPLAPYSGMVPGWMAGHYHWDACCIDVAHLCRRAGASLRLGVVQAIDPSGRVLRLGGGTAIAFDLLSLDIGSTARAPTSPAIPVITLRPLGELDARWKSLRTTMTALAPGAQCKVLVVGGGAAGVETVLATRRQLGLWAPHVALTCILATSGDTLLPELAAGARRSIAAHLDRVNIGVIFGFSAVRLDERTVVSLDGRRLEADLVLWAGSAQAHTLPAASSLACDPAGFIRVDEYLRSISHPAIFAAGDCASFVPALPKAGVFAVRMGPALAHNLRAYLLGRPMKPYRPQRRTLVLLGTGGAHAVAAWGPFAWQGKWVWRWKKRIDQRFLKQYNSL